MTGYRKPMHESKHTPADGYDLASGLPHAGQPSAGTPQPQPERTAAMSDLTREPEAVESAPSPPFPWPGIALALSCAVLGICLGVTAARMHYGWPGTILEALACLELMVPAGAWLGITVANRSARADLAACAARCEALKKAALHAERRLRNAGADASDIMCEIETADRQ